VVGIWFAIGVGVLSWMAYFRKGGVTLLTAGIPVHEET
jgi:hypothetical protein